MTRREWFQTIGGGLAAAVLPWRATPLPASRPLGLDLTAVDRVLKAQILPSIARQLQAESVLLQTLRSRRSVTWRGPHLSSPVLYEPR